MVRLCRKLSFRTAPPHYTLSSGLCFVFWAPCSLHISHIFDTKSQSHPGHLLSRSVRVFFLKSCSYQSARRRTTMDFLQDLLHSALGGTSCIVTASPSTLSHARFKRPFSTLRQSQWAHNALRAGLLSETSCQLGLWSPFPFASRIWTLSFSCSELTSAVVQPSWG
jgi:hypothetical protein